MLSFEESRKIMIKMVHKKLSFMIKTIKILNQIGTYSLRNLGILPIETEKYTEELLDEDNKELLYYVISHKP